MGTVIFSSLFYLLVDIRIPEITGKRTERPRGEQNRTENAINLEIRLPDSVLRLLSSNFTLNSINWTKFIRIILHCIFRDGNGNECIWVCVCVCVSHLLLKQRILIAHSLIHLFYHQKIHTTRESERKSDWEKRRINSNTKKKCPLWDYKRRILKFACHYIYLLNAYTLHTVQNTYSPSPSHIWTHTHNRDDFSQFFRCVSGAGWKTAQAYKYI